MPKEIKITYIDGTIETYYGDISVSEKTGILNIFPQSERGSTKIPLVQIKKYEIR